MSWGKTLKILLRDALISLLIFCVFLLVFYWLDPIKEDDDFSSRMDISFLEDTSGEMMLDDAQDAFTRGIFTEKKNLNFYFGGTTSAFWIRIATPEKLDYLALYNPNIEYIQLYIDDTILTSGWRYNSDKGDEALAYPVFHLHKTPQTPLYLRIESRYIHDYAIDFFSQHEFKYHRNLNLFINSLLSGVLFMLFISNFLVFWRVKSRVLLSFAVSVLFLTLKLSEFTGSYNLFPSKFSSAMMSLAIEMTFVYIISALWFFMTISEVRSYRRDYSRLLMGLMVLSGLGLVFCPIDRGIANLISYILSILVVIICSYIGFRVHLSGHANLRFFLVGWNFLFFIVVISIMRALGYVFDNFMVIQMSFFSIAIIYLLFFAAVVEYTNHIQLKRMEMEHQYSQAAEQVQRTEMALLQTQIKPHFLYNVLASIEYLCGVDGQKAQSAIADFSDYLRDNIDFSAELGLIPIERELENVKHYLSLEKMRFDDRLNVVYDIRADGFMVPPLVIQQMVENAVRYGVTKKQAGGTVSVSTVERALDYVIIIEDDGVGFDTNQKIDGGRTHIGIENARNRLRQQCAGTLTISSEIGKGTLVVITLPKEVFDSENDRRG